MMELPQVQRNYNRWKEKGRKKGFEAQGFNPRSVVVLQWSSSTIVAMIGPIIVSELTVGKFSFCFLLGGLCLGFCFIGEFYLFIYVGRLLGVLFFKGFGFFFPPLNGSLFASPISSIYPSSSLLWSLHFKMASWSMSRELTLLLASFPRLAILFFL